MTAKYLYKDRFFIEDDCYTPDFFSAMIVERVYGSREEKGVWAEFAIGGNNSNNITYGFSLDDVESRKKAIETLDQILGGLNDFVAVLRTECKKIEEEEK